VDAVRGMLPAAAVWRVDYLALGLLAGEGTRWSSRCWRCDERELELGIAHPWSLSSRFTPRPRLQALKWNSRGGYLDRPVQPAKMTAQRYWGLTKNPLGGNYTQAEPRDMISECSDDPGRILIWA
jgi:hypothetical protein